MLGGALSLRRKARMFNFSIFKMLNKIREELAECCHSDTLKLSKA